MQTRFPEQGFKGFKQVFESHFPGLGSQVKLPGTIPKPGSQEQVPR